MLGSHKNVVSMVGCCTHEEKMFLVIEYVPCGDLLTWLRRRRKKVRKSKKSHCSVLSCSESVDHHFLWLYSFQFYRVLGLLQIYICEDANFIPDKVLVIEIMRIFLTFVTKRKYFLPRLLSVREDVLTLSYISLDFIQGACTHSIDSQVQGARTHPQHPWNSLPPSSTSNVTIMSHSIYLAVLTYREIALTLNCILAW